MHGVQPNAKAMPINIAPSGPAGLRCACTRFSVSRNASRNTPHRVQADDDQQDAGDLAEERQPREQELADRRGRRAERDEDDREANDERERGEEDLSRATARARRLAAHFLERDSRDERDVARDQRQHARRDERQEAGREGGAASVMF